MGLTNAYRDFLVQAAVGEAVTPFNAANAYLGVGDSTAAFAATQTDLQAATNKLRKAVDSASRAGATINLLATFGGSDANWAWEEQAAFNASSAGVMMFREVTNKGTKAPGTTWILSESVAHSIA